MTIEVLDLFSAAAGGWSLGMHRAGFTTIAACEVEAWRRALYAENNPHVRLYDDVRTLTADRLRADLGRLPAVVVGSPPCQDISSANTKGKGVEGERSGLYFEAIRIIGDVRPRWFSLENSSNLRTRGADAVIAALEAIGYACWPCVVRAGDIGANHERPRAWLIGCDLKQVADADGLGWNEGWSRGRSGLDVSSALDPEHATRLGYEGGRPWRHWSHGVGASPVARGDARHSDQARQAHGCMEPSLRQAEIADDGCGAGRRDDGPGTGQMGLCAPDRGDADKGGPRWSLADLADHLRLDDGLSARLAGTRVAVGDGKGQSAASLIVEAFGDAVIPQIPEAIGRAILRTETALSAIYSTELVA